MKKLFTLLVFMSCALYFAQVPTTKIKDITKKFVMIDAKADGSVINVRYDSIIVTSMSMKAAVMSYLQGSLNKTKEIQSKYNEFKSGIIGKPTEEDIQKMEKFLSATSKIAERQKVLVMEKLQNADSTKKIIINSRAVYYLKLDDGITDGIYESNYYFTQKGIPIDDIYEYFLENIK